MVGVACMGGGGGVGQDGGDGGCEHAPSFVRPHSGCQGPTSRDQWDEMPLAQGRRPLGTKGTNRQDRTLYQTARPSRACPGRLFRPRLVLPPLAAARAPPVLPPAAPAGAAAEVEVSLVA